MGLRGRAAVAALTFASTLIGIMDCALTQPAGKLVMTVSGVRNTNGVVRCALFNSPAAFPKPGQEWCG
jgi:uncharacterized protein (DUF2141 family)